MRLLMTMLLLFSAVLPAQAALIRVPVIVSPAFRAPIRIFPAKFVAAGGHVRPWEVSARNPDCSSNGPVTFRIRTAPQHGTIRIESARIFPSYPPGNPRSVCNTRRVAGQRVSYFARAGFVGTDRVAFESIYPGGQAQLINIPIGIR